MKAQERKVSLTRAEHLLLKFQYVPGLGEDVKKLRELVSVLKTAARAKVPKVGKLPAKRWKRMDAIVESKVVQARVELETWNARVAE